MEYLIVLGVGAAVGWFVGWHMGYSDTSERNRKIGERERQALALEAQASAKNIETCAIHKNIEALLAETRAFGESLGQGMLSARKWLADAFAEYIELRDLEVECWLALKPHPSWKASQVVGELRAKHREAVRSLKFLEYQVASYEEYFPVLADYRDAILDEAVDLRRNASAELEDCDAALSNGYLSREEYDKLPTSEKFQKALDRYWAKPKSTFGIGRLYERFWGAKYEADGWRVAFNGILKGKDDFGRDLICEKGNETHIVQCKCWSKDKVLREKHIFQLFGTVVQYRLSNPGRNVTAIFACTTSLSPEATMVARELKVNVQQIELTRYPMIKCNINPKTNERIYHLPFDQQYDRVVIGAIEGERYVETVAQAEFLGFRRAWRWKGNSSSEEAI